MMLHSWKFLFGILPAALVIVVGLARFLPSSIVVFLIGVSLLCRCSECERCPYYPQLHAF